MHDLHASISCAQISVPVIFNKPGVGMVLSNETAFPTAGATPCSMADYMLLGMLSKWMTGVSFFFALEWAKRRLHARAAQPVSDQVNCFTAHLIYCNLVGLNMCLSKIVTEILL